MELRKAPSVIISRVGLLALFVGAVVACQAHFLSYRGAVARQESRLALREGGPHREFWRARDLSVSYHYWRGQGKLELSGTVELANGLRHNFTTLEHLFLQAHLLDAEGRVLESRGILTSEYRHMVRKLRFKRCLELPPGTTAIAFSYTGRVRDGGGTGRVLGEGGDGDSWDFWMHPFLKGSESHAPQGKDLPCCPSSYRDEPTTLGRNFHPVSPGPLVAQMNLVCSRRPTRLASRIHPWNASSTSLVCRRPVSGEHVFR